MAAPDPTRVEIGELRWPVIIAERVQVPDPFSPSILEDLRDSFRTRAKVIPIGAQTFLGMAQTDRPITHWIWLRWLDWIGEQHVVIRSITRRDGTVRTDAFRVRRVGEVDGRQRFVRIEAELERRT